MKDILIKKIEVRIEHLQGLVNDSEYDGMSSYYYYLHEDMPRYVSNMHWAINDLCIDILGIDEATRLTKLLDSINY